MKKFILALMLSQATACLGEVYESVVLGGGVGGLTSALYLSRAGLHPLVIEGQNPGGALGQAPIVQNWPGVLEIHGNDLVEKIKKQALEQGAKIEPFEVVGVDFSGSPLKILVRDPLDPKAIKEIETKTCIIATGALPKKLGVPGEEQYWLKGVHTCAVCDGNLYKDSEHIAIVGGGDAAITEAFHLAKLAKKVTLLVRGSELKSVEQERKQSLLKLPNVEVLYRTTIQRLEGKEGVLSHIVTKDKEGNDSMIAVQALFLAIGSTPNTQMFDKQLELDQHGHIILHDVQATNKEGVFALGDASDPIFRQAITAAGDGAKAALQVEKYLSSHSQSTQEASQTAVKSEEKKEILIIRNFDHFQREVLDSSTPVVVDFYADWCGPCKILEAYMAQWSKQLGSKIKFAKVNIDQLPKLAQRYAIRAVPTVLYFDKQGVLVESRTGVGEIASMIAKLDAPSQEPFSKTQ